VLSKVPGIAEADYEIVQVEHGILAALESYGFVKVTVEA
jgi:hypothetical protein